MKETTTIRRWTNRVPQLRTFEVITDRPGDDGVQFIKQYKHL